VEQENTAKSGESRDALVREATAWKLQVLLAEFGRLKDEISSHKSSQQTILNFIIVLAATEIAAMTRIPWDRAAGWLSLEGLLLIPIPFGLLAMYHSGYTIRIHKLGAYIDSELRAKLESIAGDGTLRAVSYVPITSPLGIRRANLDGRLVYVSLLGLKALPQLLPILAYFALKITVWQWWTVLAVTFDLILLVVSTFGQHD
jgi:hypothetical protein